jgi:hypothetical protein
MVFPNTAIFPHGRELKVIEGFKKGDGGWPEKVPIVQLRWFHGCASSALRARYTFCPSLISD